MCTYVHVHQVQCGVLPQLTAEGLQLLVLVPVLVPYFLYLSQLLVISCSLAFHMHYSKCASYQCKLKPWFWRIGSIQVHAWPHHIPTNTATALSWRLKKRACLLASHFKWEIAWECQLLQLTLLSSWLFPHCASLSLHSCPGLYYHLVLYDTSFCLHILQL